MSYSVSVSVKDGVPSINEAGTSVPPDGTYTVNGHVPVEGTWQAESITVTRFTPDGKTVIQASGTHHL